MIKDKTFYMGYGTVLGQSCSFTRRLSLKYILPPVEIGMKKSNEEVEHVEVLEEVIFNYGSDMKEFLKLLDTVSESNAVIQFRDYAFDFTNYNPKSVEVMKIHFERVVKGWQLAWAC